MIEREFNDRQLSRSRRRHARFRLGLGACVVLTTAVVAPSMPPTPVAVASHLTDTEVLNAWNVIAQNATAGIRPTAHGTMRGIAMVQGAVYDAVNAIDRGHQPYLLDVDELGIDPGASIQAAIATAAHDVLVAIVTNAVQLGIIEAAYTATRDDVANGAAEDAGVAAGAAAADAMLDFRDHDGFMAPFVFDPGDQPGDWRPDTPTALDPDPWVSNLKPFLINSPEQFRTDGPNALTSDAYTQDFNEVKSLGAINSTTRTADQTKAAIFWQFSPIPLWNRLSRELAGGQGLDVVDEARLLAMVNLAGADAAIACWNDKYYWQFWRPMPAIREAGTDENPATIADPTWTPLFDPATQTTPPLANPPFPDHPSGHGCLSGAVLNTMRNFFGTDKIAFDVNSGRFPNDPRHFDRFSHALKEIIDARVWGGIHFRTADVQGTVIGKKVAHWAEKHYFQPVD
jgi:hypothetical protein